MSKMKPQGWFLVSSLLILSLSSIALAQTPYWQGQVDDFSIDDELPPGLLLTDRGRALAEELRQLRRTEEQLGGKHPSLQELRRRIADVKEQMEAWSPRVQDFASDGSRPLPDALPEMNDHDLRQLVLRMAAKISQLEKRVETLEASRSETE